MLIPSRKLAKKLLTLPHCNSKTKFLPYKFSIRNFNVENGKSHIDIEFNTLIEMQIKSCEVNKDHKFLGTMIHNEFQYITYGDFAIEVDKFRQVLHCHGLRKDDKVALISNNRVEWAIAYYAANGLGAQIVPMYEAQPESDWKNILNDSCGKMILAASETVFHKVKAYIGKVGCVEHVLCFDDFTDPTLSVQLSEEEKDKHSYNRWMSNVKLDCIPPPIEATPDDLTAILYTSGTTGLPKGVELSHRNIVNNIRRPKTMWERKELERRKTGLSFIPWSHVFGMTASLHGLLGIGASAAIVPHKDRVMECMMSVKPAALTAVPLMLNRMYNGVQAGVAQVSPLKQAIVKKAFEIARQRNNLLEFHKPVPAMLEWKYGVVDRIVMSKLRAKLTGGNAEFLFSGGAALSMPVLQFFEDVGLPIIEGYGLTETSPVVTCSTRTWEYRRLGCVGVAIPGTTLRIVDPHDHMMEVPLGEEGEITVGGDSVMVGYHKNEAATQEAIYHHNGIRYFRTGDLGSLVDQRFLKITGRIKEMYKLSNGKFVMPAPLEDMLCRSNYIAQACVGGANECHNVVLIVPDFIEIRKWIQAQNLELTGFEVYEDIIQHPAVLKLLSSQIFLRMNESDKKYDAIHRFAILLEPFSQENEMLTAKMSVRRNRIYNVYKSLYENLHLGKVGHVVVSN